MSIGANFHLSELAILSFFLLTYSSREDSLGQSPNTFLTSPEALHG